MGARRGTAEESGRRGRVSGGYVQRCHWRESSTIGSGGIVKVRSGPSPVAMIMARAGSSIGSDRSDCCIPDSGSGDSDERSDRSNDCCRASGSSQSDGSSSTRRRDNGGQYGNRDMRVARSVPIPVAVISARTGSSVGSRRSDNCIHVGGGGDSNEGSWGSW